MQQWSNIHISVMHIEKQFTVSRVLMSFLPAVASVYSFITESYSLHKIKIQHQSPPA
jgi:hypothetical protein